ncbi:unnamed protein product [Clonostachys solani]|uniref:NmrA-like domain-containing protein n=1 Tax=Clonostachys solani TaxID=160281 RepID=A0A9N9Z360_9HYPO|nr:unnamed protein product [Clonostachys solani]
MSQLSVFVCGATGIQGGALARHLIHQGSAVHALTRDPGTAKSKTLEALGVKLWQGDYDNEKALREAISGTNTVFINFMPDFSDFGANLRHAKLILGIAKQVGVTQIVYSSHSVPDIGALTYYDPNSMVAVIHNSKKDIEKEVKAAGFKYFTILRPGYFMTNVLAFHNIMFPGLAETGATVTSLRPDTNIPLLDDETMGVFPSAVINDPERFNGKEILYADEYQTVTQIFEKLSKVAGRELKMVPMSDEDIEAQKTSNPFIGGQFIIRDMEKIYDMDEVKSWGLPLSTFDKFLEREADAIRAVYSKNT